MAKKKAVTKSKAKSRAKTSPKSLGKFDWIIKWAWIGAGVGVLTSVAIFVLVSFSQLPDTQELENPKYEYATKIFSSDLQELGKYYRVNRDWVTFDELSDHVVNALIATEDIRYYDHSGIDPRGTARALFFLGKRGGASTITQQLAKLFFHERPQSTIKTIWQKLQEWVIASELEKRYTKEEIIAMYLNKFEFRYNSFGISTASKTYFNKHHTKLKIEEAAMLIGMLKSPYYYNPVVFPEKARLRRSVVLNQMMKADFITEAEYDSLKAVPLDLQFKKEDHNTGPAPYFRSELTKWLKAELAKPENAKPGGGSYDLYQDGLRVFTTIDMKTQMLAEKAVQKSMKATQEKFFKRWEGKDPWSYNADEDQKRIRTESLNRLIRNSDRFIRMKDAHMSEVYNSISSDFPEARLLDIDVLRMKRDHKKPGHLANLVSRSVITKKQSNTYKKIMNSKHFDLLLKQWDELQKKSKVAFNKKQKMRVFAYNAEGEKDTIMTPLDSIRYHRMHLQTGMLAMDPSTGEVKAWVGGINHKYFKYDHIHSRRQVGSTFKPFVYSTAIFNLGISPCQKVVDKQYYIPAGEDNFKLLKTWAPQNSKGTFTGESLTLYEGLKQSLNSVSVWLMLQLGNANIVRDFADKLGVNKEHIPNQPSICLGSADLTVFEMTGAYGTFANNGIYNKPVLVTRIEDRNGKLIYSAVPEQRKVFPDNYNYVMVDMLKEAASFIQPNFEVEVGGKTGTTNDYVDGWFMGITPNLVVGTWVGGEDPWIRFRSLINGQGGAMARPIFIDFLKRIEADKSIGFDKTATFKRPAEDLGIEIDCTKYEGLYGEPEKANVPEEDEIEEL